MAFKDGAGSTAFRAFRPGPAGAAVGAYAAVPVSPHDGVRTASTAVILTVNVSTSAGDNADVRFEVSTTSDFAALVWGTTLLNLAPAQQSVTVSGLTSGTRYYWRARAAAAGTTGWGAWSGGALAGTSVYTATATTTAATASSALDAPMNAVDGSVNTWWHSGAEMPTWWRGQFPSAQVFNRMTLVNRNWSTARTPKDFLIQGSNDGTTFTTLATLTGVTWSSAAEMKTFDFANTTAYLYTRVYVTANNGDNYESFAEIVFLNGTTTYAPTPLSFIPDLNASRAFGVVEANMGIELLPEADVTSVAYVDENMGFERLPEPDVTSVAYVDLNSGVEITRDSDGMEYGYYGDVNTLTPTPHIWFLKPKSGRPGDGLRVICFGVGDLQSTFSGVVEAFFPGTGWATVPVLGWQTYLPTSNAYTELRMIDELAEIIDMQHSVIEITVPLSALPPGVPVRIKTNGA